MINILKIIIQFLIKYRKYVPITIELIIKLNKKFKLWRKEKDSSQKNKNKN